MKNYLFDPSWDTEVHCELRIPSARMLRLLIPLFFESSLYSLFVDVGFGIALLPPKYKTKSQFSVVKGIFKN